MDEKITIPLGDKRLGSYPENAPRIWPEVDVLGNPFIKRNSSRQKLISGDKTYFVVLPVNWKGGEIEVEQPVAPAPTTAPEAEAQVVVAALASPVPKDVAPARGRRTVNPAEG